MPSAAPTSLEAFCAGHGVSAPFEMHRIRSGRNSEVWRVTNAEGTWILKNYYSHHADTQDRLGIEFGFLTLLESAQIGRVAKPMAMDREENCALYSFLRGQRPSRITDDLVEQSARFVVRMNGARGKPGAALQPAASDSCFELGDHLRSAERRIARLASIALDLGAPAAARQFIEKRVKPRWDSLRVSLEAEAGRAAWGRRLGRDEQILSQSDSGFHNTLESDGELFFVDFEYAGWDDPAKLICDFICQPELPVSDAQGRIFQSNLASALPDSDGINLRVSKLLPVHRIKWIGILLNEFTAESSLRRAHAGIEGKEVQETQLAKAELYFDTYLAQTAKE